MNHNNDLEREPVRGVIGNSGALPMYYVSKKNSKRPLIFYSKNTKIKAYFYAVITIATILFFCALISYAVYGPQPLG